LPAGLEFDPSALQLDVELIAALQPSLDAEERSAIRRALHAAELL
jgi:hypothetical protein